jgi:hypothetical protein
LDFFGQFLLGQPFTLALPPQAALKSFKCDLPATRLTELYLLNEYVRV